MDDSWNQTKLRRLKVVQLRKKLAALGLPLNGLKADLIKRLLFYYANQQNMVISLHPDPSKTSQKTCLFSHEEKEPASPLPIPSMEMIDTSAKTTEQVSSNPEKIECEEEGTPREISDLESLLVEAIQAKQKATTRNKKRKLRKKRKLEEKKLNLTKSSNPKEFDDNLDFDFIEDEIPKDSIYYQFVKVFAKFKTSDENFQNLDENCGVDSAKKMLERKKPCDFEFKNDENDCEPKLSKRKLKQMSRMTVADLKQKFSHPELVEMHDVTAKDPFLLLHLKSIRNSVPVPRHWCYKRKYLQGKRGFDKPPFKLPDFIRKTGIMEMRQALQEKEDMKSSKTRQREKIRPKLGKIDIDYQKLHDAFFKWQTKPKMTIHGDIYYEGKEFETRLKDKKPGDLSNELRVALGMPTGPNAHRCPPPWLIAMQRYGPPPSYPNIKIPGLNVKIPDGCSFGFHAGGWGKPPVDEFGRPLYGDVFGGNADLDSKEEEIDDKLWGEMESDEEEEEEEEEEVEEQEEEAGIKNTCETQDSGSAPEGFETPSGFSTTPDIELRKRKIEGEMESVKNAALYKIIPEKKTTIGKLMPSIVVYDVTGSLNKGQGVDFAIDPDNFEMPCADFAAKSQQAVTEDLSDMVAEHVARQKRKKVQDNFKQNKKYKDFKF